MTFGGFNANAAARKIRKAQKAAKAAHPVCQSCQSCVMGKCPGVDRAMSEADALDKCSVCHERRKDMP